MSNSTTRRNFLKGVGAGASLYAVGGVPPLFAQSRQTVRVGYLHTLAVDGQIWLADHMGTWRDEGLDMEFTQFTTGLELFQALVGGSLDVLATGAVVSNFPARGQGEVFLINNVELATAQLWADPEAGINDIQDLKGKQIATTEGTTAHVFLHQALTEAGLDPENDVEIINQRMSDAVTAFISGAVSAVALWVPFNVQVQEQRPEARMLVDASEYYPEAAIVGGWAARGEFYRNNPDVIRKIIRGWVPANDHLVNNPDEALATLQQNYYQNVSLEQLKAQYEAERVFTSQEWVSRYKDGTVTEWLDQVTDFFVEFGGIDNPRRASEYFHTGPYLDVVAR
ncbi:ABC transporter substrate-binding protein [Aquisalimonas lutea]|uniref:ABC transporter substrate-binding protein n=1 Tax=Aquisalimonas lutea TaxID=1327750 RepID=UPI0025B309FD|nr:ABC transporter substrate-binding protein [Aquisalimonas lutea]MDN3516477.1 ABC transporter substrate-binding protein [Aquisalimonas lutea]